MIEISNNRRIFGIIAIFILFGCSVVAVELVGHKVLSGARGYIYGEGQWAKAQKRASIALLSFVSTQDKMHYNAFLNHLEVHEGDRVGRLTLLSENPDIELAIDGFLQGGIPPEDVDDMIWLLLNFNNLPAISDAINYWEQGDKQIDVLRRIGEEVFLQVENGTLTQEHSQRYLREIVRLDEELTQHENHFSNAMSKAARWASNTVFWSAILISLSFIIIAAIACITFMRNLKKANDRLLISEDKFRTVLDNSRDVIYQYRKEAKGYDYLSRSVEDMLGYLYQKIKNGGPKFILERIHPEDESRMKEELEKLTGTERRERFLDDTEFRVKKADGTYIWINNKRTPIMNSEGVAIAIVGNVRDISARKERMNKLDDSLKENQMLLSEVHHRVKNNLAIVSSLIELKKWEMDEDERGHFSDLQSRIKSIALVHEKLYGGEAFSEIELSQYIKELGDMIGKSYNLKERNVEIIYDLEPVQVGINHAVPIGLICNEMINNAFKHAFTGKSDEYLKIELKKKRENVVLSVIDSVGGLPKGFSIDSQTSLGMTLIKRLSKQLNGAFEIEGGKETTFRVTFPENKNRAH
ncbi:MAG: histidine kinase dimerization/phosphoacceptor domain -containing protein [Balneolaceae bacterium]